MSSPALKRLATRLKLPLVHNPALEDEHGLCGCVECYLAWTAGPPDRPSKLEQRILPVLLGEMFAPGFATKSPALQLLEQLAAEEKAAQQAKAKPGEFRRSKVQEAKLAAAKADGEAVPEGEVTRESLIASRNDWMEKELIGSPKGSARGWLMYASLAFKLTEKTIRNRIR